MDRCGMSVRQSRLRWYNHVKCDGDAVARKKKMGKIKEEVFGSGEGRHACRRYERENMKGSTETYGESTVATFDGKA